MALKFNVSAPGKVILNGEHSVVYGKPALAGVVDLRNYLTFEADNKNCITFKFHIIATPISFDLNVINLFLNELTKYFENVNQLPEQINHDEYLVMIKEFVGKNLKTSGAIELYDKTLCSVLYLLMGILISCGCFELKYGFTITMNSDISIGSGIGSSASFAVCLAAAFYFYSMLRISSNFIEQYNKNTIDEQNSIKTIISNWAYCSEKIMHGNPSGIDNTICTFGNIVRFSKGTQAQTIKLTEPLNILLVNTGISRSTAKLVQTVSDLKMQHLNLINHILDAMEDVVEDVAMILKENDFNAVENFQKLEILIKINNNLLRSIGVSHPSLEKIFQISDLNGFSSKLTGAGGGGFAFVLLPKNYREMDSFQKLCNCFQQNNLEYNITTIGGDGLKIENLT